MSPTVKTCSVCGRRFERGEEFCPRDGTPLAQPGPPPPKGANDPLIGVLLDQRYRILKVIGEGGMGIVYEAEHVLIEKRVAVKVLRADFTRKPDVVARFRQEARSASRIGHPNIIDVIDFGQTPAGASYFVMEKLVGEDIAELLARESVLSSARAVHLVHQCCKALAAAHEKGIFHRDLKPENLFLVRNEHGAEMVKVVDFGVAKMTDLTQSEPGARKLTRTGMLFGTPEYMSPEQSKGLTLDHRADIYALGIILYELVTGRVPFEGENFMEVLHKHGNNPVPSISSVNPGTQISAPLRAVIDRALEKDRERRFQSMADMAAALSGTPEMPAPERSEGPPPWALVPPPRPAGASGEMPRGGRRAQQVQPDAGFDKRDTLTTGTRLWLGGAALAAAAVIGVVLLASGPEDAASQVTKVAAPILVRSAAVAEPGAVPLAGPEPATEGPPDKAVIDDTPVVNVTLTSQPSGARVEVDGMGVLCDRTPCSVGLSQGVPMLMRFSNKGVASRARVVPDRDGQNVFVNLQRQGQPRAAESPRNATTAANNGLKIPAAFR